MQKGTLLDEDFPSRVEAVFPDTDSARAASTALCQRYGLEPSQFSYVTLQQETPCLHSNRFAFNASGWTLQKRQVKRTLLAFALVLGGVGLVQLLYTLALLSNEVATVLLAVLIIAAVGLTVTGMLSWRPARARARTQPRNSNEVVLVVAMHDLSEQYELRQALKEMGAETEPGNIAEVA